MIYILEIIVLALFFTSILFIIIIFAVKYAMKKWMKEYLPFERRTREIWCCYSLDENGMRVKGKCECP